MAPPTVAYFSTFSLKQPVVAILVARGTHGRRGNREIRGQ